MSTLRNVSALTQRLPNIKVRFICSDNSKIQLPLPSWVFTFLASILQLLKVLPQINDKAANYDLLFANEHVWHSWCAGMFSISRHWVPSTEQLS